MSATLDLCSELITRRSISPEDDGCQLILGARLEKLGFTVEHMPFGKVSNLWARRGKTSPLVCFAGHTDVVPPGDTDQWQSDAFTATVRDGHLYGRGAADMKGSLAAMITACERFLGEHDGFDGSIAFLITSDEESVAVDGTKRVIETLQSRGETFALTSDDGSRLAIGSDILIDHDGYHSERTKLGMIALAAGYHPITVLYFQAGGGQALDLAIAQDGATPQSISAAWLFHQGDTPP